MEIKIYNKMPSEAAAIRKQVFILEQGFGYDHDEKDEIATHIVVYDEKEPIATCRLFETDTKGTYMFGRLAVNKDRRKGGVGSMVIDAAAEYVKQNGGNCIILHAQMGAKEFYTKVGFTAFGDIEYEQGCPHIWMKKEF